MRHRRSPAPSAHAYARVPSPSLYHGHGAPLNSPTTTVPFDWRALGVLLLAIALAWLGAVAFTDLDQPGSGEPDATAQVAR